MDLRREKVQVKTSMFIKAWIVLLFVVCLLPGYCTRANAAVTRFKSVSLGSEFTAVIDTDGNLWMVGFNECGVLGYGDDEEFESLLPIKIMDHVKAISMGSRHGAAIKTDNSLWTWGFNQNGALGNGTTVDSMTPIKIMDHVESVTLGYSHSAAIKTDGTLWIWGQNYHGQLGNGTTANSTTPIKIMNNVKSVSMSDRHSAAIKTDGTLWIWGDNTYGQLGNGTTVDSTKPIQIMDNVKSVSLGSFHSAAVKTDGSLWTWGYDGSGVLGIESAAHGGFSSETPIKIMDNVKDISVRQFQNAAITNDGSLWMWGANSNGEMGNGASGPSVCNWTPEKILSNVVCASLGPWHSAAIKTDGSLWTWGGNYHGELGNGTTEKSTTPIHIKFEAISPITPITSTTEEEPTTPTTEAATERSTAEVVPKVPTVKATIKMNVAKGSTVIMQLKQKTSAVKATKLTKGDKVTSWKSSNKKIVTVTSKGKLTAKKVGTATITVKSKKGASYTFKVKVQKGAVKTTKISGVAGKYTLKKGEKLKLKPVLSPVTANQKVTYTSSKKSVASVKNGTVTAHKKGKAVITVKSGSKKKKITITVK